MEDDGFLLAMLLTEDEDEFEHEVHQFKTVKVDIRHKDEILRRRLPQALSAMGLRKTKITDEFRVSYERAYPFSLGAFILAFAGVFLVALVWLQIDYSNWYESLSLIYRLGTPSIRPNLLLSLLIASTLALVVRFLWGQTKLGWEPLSIRLGSKYLYLQFDVTQGDAYMIQLLDEMEIPVQNDTRPSK